MTVVAPASVTATASSDTQAVVTWPVDASWSGVDIERWDSWTNKRAAQTALPVSVNSWADTTMQPDRQFQWWVRAYNSTGFSDWTASNIITTSPLPPGGITVQRSGTDIIVSWKNTSSLDVSYEYEYTTDGTTWAAPVAVAADTFTTTLSGTDPTLPYTFQLRAVYAGVSGSWSDPVAIAAITAPAAPTNLSPANDAYVLAGSAVPASLQHNPLDGTAMTAYRVVYTVNGGAAVDTGQVAATSFGFSFPALTAGDVVDWQAQTWGAATDPSPLSDPPAEFNVAAAPAVTITSPADGSTVAQSTAQVSFTFTGSGQAGGTVALYDAAGTTLLASHDFTGTSGTQPLPMTLVNNTSYQLHVTVVDTDGLGSATAVSNFSVAFVPPPTPSLDIELSNGGGSLTVTVVNPDPGPTGTAAVSNRLYRKIGDGAWETLSTDLPPNTGYIDYTAPVAGLVTYRGIAVSSAPTYSNTGDVPVMLDPVSTQEYIYLSAGPGFSLIGRFRGMPKVETSHARNKLTRSYFNRKLPVSYTGTNTKHAVNFGGTIEQNDPMSTEARFTAIRDWPGLVLYRDAFGHQMVGQLGGLSFKQQPFNLQDFSATITRAQDGSNA